jgi:MFS transporter, FHS family, Na+ dependent glucose transporter 1
LIKGFSLAKDDKLVKTAGYCLAYISLGLVISSLGPTLLGLAENTGSQFREISYLFIARNLGQMLFSLLGGRLYDRLPGHVVMGAALFMLVISMTLVPLIPQLPLLIAVVFILGIANGTIDVGANALLVWIYQARVGPFMNALHFTFGVGAFIGPIIITQVISGTGGEITWAYWTLALLIVPSALWLLALPSPAIQTGAEDTPAGRINYGLLFLIAFFFFVYGGAEVSFGGWVSSYVVALNLTTEASAAYLTSGYYGAISAGRLLVIPIAARLRPRTILFGDFAGCLLGLAIILIWPTFLPAIWVGTIILGISAASVFPVMLSFAERRMRITGKTTGFFLVGASLGGMTTPWLIGQLFEPIGPQVAIWGVTASLVAALAVLIVLIIYSSRIVVREE